MTCHKMDEENLAGIMFCFQIAIYLRVLMDALLKHLGPGQDFSICHSGLWLMTPSAASLAHLQGI